MEYKNNVYLIRSKKQVCNMINMKRTWIFSY